MTSRTTLDNYCDLLLAGKVLEEPGDLSLAELRDLYGQLVARLGNKSPAVSIINLGDVAFVLFPQLSQQTFMVRDHRDVQRESFGFLPNLTWYGPTERLMSFWTFLWNEVRLSRLRLLVILVVSIAVLALPGVTSQTLGVLNALLVQTATLFLTIYLIFTVAQSQRLSQDVKLFEKGILSKYYADDRNITLLGIVTVASIFANTLAADILPAFASNVTGPISSLLTYAPRVLSALVLTLLFHMFFTVADYYLGRSKDVAERDIVSALADREFSAHHKGTTADFTYQRGSKEVKPPENPQHVQ